MYDITYWIYYDGFFHESDERHRVAAYVAMTFAAIYAVLVFLVYFAQTTSVRLDSLGEQARGILDFSRGGLLFNYDLLGYGMMALSTFFLGLTIDAFNAGSWNLLFFLFYYADDGNIQRHVIWWNRCRRSDCA